MKFVSQPVLTAIERCGVMANTAAQFLGQYIEIDHDCALQDSFNLTQFIIFIIALCGIYS